LVAIKKTNSFEEVCFYTHMNCSIMFGSGNLPMNFEKPCCLHYLENKFFRYDS